MKMGHWPLGRPVTIFFRYLESAQTLKFKFSTLLWFKNVQTLHDEQRSPMAPLQIPTGSHVINFGTKLDLNIP
jgi:hypothetical protein